MNLQIVQILDRGVPNKERLWLKAMADINLKFYIVVVTTYITPRTVSNNPKYTFWFYDKNVKAGDNVVLCTGKGVSSESPNPSGGTNHYIYWGLPDTVWNKTGDCAILFEINTWAATKYE